MARKKGSRNRGYWFRAGRGWGVTEDGRFVPLRDDKGKPIKDRAAKEEAKVAYAAYLLTKPRSGATVREVCSSYLDSINGSTFDMRVGILYDFCSGFPARFRKKQEKEKKPSDRLHPGHGDRLAEDLTTLDVTRWVDAHKGWKTGRIQTQAIRRALNHGVEVGLIERNPLKGIKVKPVGKRVTYFTDKQEEALLKAASPAMRLALKVCIATGARPMIEFGSLEARHAEETERGQVWRFPPEETKTGRERVIYVPDEIAEIVRKLKRKHRKGKLFRREKGEPWTGQGMRHTFARLRKKVKLDDDAVFYTCRHTFAKRKLGEGVSLEILAGLMGNSPQVCWDHYAKWSDQYTDPMWNAIKGRTG